MNHDFLLDCTPANARRLVRLAKVIASDLDPAIAAIAQQDYESDDATNLPALERRETAAVRFLRDCKLRAVLPHTQAPTEALKVALAASMLEGNRRFTILFTTSTVHLHAAIRSLGLTMTHDSYREADVYFHRVAEGSAFDDHLISRRDGVLIGWHEGISYDSSFRTYALLYPRMILIGQPKKAIKPSDIWTHYIEEMVSVLFPKIDTRALDLADTAARKEVIRMNNFKRYHPYHLAFLFNVCTDFLPEVTQLEEIADRDRVDRVDRIFSMFKSKS